MSIKDQVHAGNKGQGNYSGKKYAEPKGDGHGNEKPCLTGCLCYDGSQPPAGGQRLLKELA